MKPNVPKYNQKLRLHIILIFLIGFTFTSLASYYFYQVQIEDQKIRQNVLANSIVGTIQKRLQNYELALIQAKAFLMNISVLNENIFKQYLRDTELMNRYPGMQALAYVANIQPENLSKHINEIRKDFPKYKIWPQSESTEFMPVAYIAPVDWRNSRAIGFNMMSEPIRRIALEKARDTGKPTMSGRLNLVQENGVNHQAGIIFFVPIYGKSMPTTISERRKQLTAYVTSPFRIRDLISAIIPHSLPGEMDFKIYTGEEINEASLLYHHEQFSDSRLSEDEKAFTIKSMAIGGNIYKIHFYNNSKIIQVHTRYFPLIIAFLGFVLTLVIMKNYYIIQQQIIFNKLAIESRDEFLSIASHELKTPLTSLQMRLQMARREFQPKIGLLPNPEKQIKILDDSLLHVRKLSRLIDDLLETTKVENGKLTFSFEKTDLTKLINSTLESHSEQIVSAGSKLDLNLPEGIFVECDQFRMEQVISNLLTNAIKYGEGSLIKLTLRNDNKNIIFTIKDGGPGIPENLQHSIFERFKRVSSNKSISGLGLGLYITKQIVLAHKGSLHINSVKGQGAEFIVVLPLNQESN
jgi:two-component system OmpR family sensor kinase